MIRRRDRRLPRNRVAPHVTGSDTAADDVLDVAMRQRPAPAGTSLEVPDAGIDTMRLPTADELNFATAGGDRGGACAE